LLLEIMNYGMDVFEEAVLSQVMPIADPVERLKACMEKNILLVTRGWSKEVTVILHEHTTLTGEARGQINARKKRYVRFLESSFAEAVREGRIRPVNPKVAAFAFLGMVLWIYKWFRPDGAVGEEELAREMQDLFFGGLEIHRRGARRPGPERQRRRGLGAPSASSDTGRTCRAFVSPRGTSPRCGARRVGRHRRWPRSRSPGRTRTW